MYFSLLARNFLQPGIQHNARSSLFNFSTAAPFSFRLHHGLRSKSSTALPMIKRTGAQDGRNFTSFMKAATIVGIGLGFSTLNRPPIHCDGEFNIGCYEIASFITVPQSRHPKRRTSTQSIHRLTGPLLLSHPYLYINWALELLLGCAQESSLRKARKHLHGSSEVYSSFFRYAV